MAFANLHHHSMYSIYDGFGQPRHAAARAKALGQRALALTDHGTVSGLIDHYTACNDEGIKPVLGVEAYFQPIFDKNKPRYHMLVFAMNLTGYHNLMRALTEANRDNFYREGRLTLETLERHQEGLIITSGCLAGYMPRQINAGKPTKAMRIAERLQGIFGDRLYIELQANDIPEQVKANKILLKIADALGISAILTPDSHYIEKEDFPTYEVAHEIAQRGHDADYSHLYMPSEKLVVKRWMRHMPEKYHGRVQGLVNETHRLAMRCDVKLDFPAMLPKVDWGMPSTDKLFKLARKGLRVKNLWPEVEYQERLRYELDIIRGKGFEDYFLMCWDIVEHARKQGIGVGFGRGSVCGSLLAFAIGLTEVDPLVLGTAFERFMRPDKNTMPDIDMDFDSVRRGEVLAYIQQRYSGKSAPISTFGYYKARNLLNDLAKKYKVTEPDLQFMRSVIGEELNASDDALADVTEEVRRLPDNSKLRKYNMRYPGIIDHFTKLYDQVRYIGKHPAGVAIAPDDIDKYVALLRIKGQMQTSYDMLALDKINVLKLDALGLNTVSVMMDAIRATKQVYGADVGFEYTMLNDRKTIKGFQRGDTDGIFQLEKQGAKDILTRVKPTDVQDVIAINALNRPAPIKLGMVEQFIAGKNGDVDEESYHYPYTKDTYGTLVYQEQLMAICRGVAHMEWADIDKLMKRVSKKTSVSRGGKDEFEEMFVRGAVKHTKGITVQEAKKLYRSMIFYLFNKSHGAGYTLIAWFMMYIKQHYPVAFYYASLKNENKDPMRANVLLANAVHSGVIVMLPHINETASYSIRRWRGEWVLQQGLTTIKGIGNATANAIEKKGKYGTKADLVARMTGREMNSRAIQILTESGACEFDAGRYRNRVEKYNAALYARGQKGLR